MAVGLDELLAWRKLPVADVRGAGLMWGIELNQPASPIARELLSHGFVVGTAREKVLRLLPPYIVPKKALSEFIEKLGVILSRVDGEESPASTAGRGSLAPLGMTRKEKAA